MTALTVVCAVFALFTLAAEASIAEQDITSAIPAPVTTLSPSECPDGWINGGYLGCFYFHHEEKQLNWAEAQAACEKLGGYLAEIKTMEQNNLIKSMAIIEEKFCGVESWWIGLSDIGHEGRWLWGHSVADTGFTSWLRGYPNNATGNQDDCVAIAMSEHFHWKDVSCTDTNLLTSPSPICQRDIEDMVMITPATTTTAPAPTTTPFQVAQCSRSYYTILNNAWRKIDYYNKGTKTYYCDDSLRTGWYRLEGAAGTQLPTSPAPNGTPRSSSMYCGTHAPAYIKADHPTPQEGIVSREVCFEWDGDKCYRRTNIQVAACYGEDSDIYYVYELGPPGSCQLAYCGL